MFTADIQKIDNMPITATKDITIIETIMEIKNTEIDIEKGKIFTCMIYAYL